MSLKQDAIAIFASGVSAVQPSQLLTSAIIVENEQLVICGKAVKKNSFEKLFVIGAGKAAAAMAIETENILGDILHSGLVVTKYGHSLAAQKIRIIEAAHPVPDENSVKGVDETLGLLNQVCENDLVICLISGGASSLWCDVPHGISLQHFQQLADQLVNSGADIQEINIVRKHLSLIKGGQLLKYCTGARVFSLIISDVPGDDLSVIGSGPTSPDYSTFEQANEILIKYKLYDRIDPSIKKYIEDGLNGFIPETIKANDLIFQSVTNTIIGNNSIAAKAAVSVAHSLDYETMFEERLITGDNATAAKNFVARVLNYAGSKPLCILQGGETTLHVTGKGKGGRNQHFVLAALHQIMISTGYKKKNSIVILSGGTDGTDGPTDAAGAVLSEKVFAEMESRNIAPDEYLSCFDSYHFFEKTDGLLITGPTQTNVMDIMIALINPDLE
ncbi:MAG: DUF4147 domain-containing protein [Flavitalea sp.]